MVVCDEWMATGFFILCTNYKSDGQRLYTKRTYLFDNVRLKAYNIFCVIALKLSRCLLLR